MDETLSPIHKWSNTTTNAVPSPAVVDLIMPFLAEDTISCPCIWHQRTRRLCKHCKLVLRLGMFVMLMLEFTILQSLIPNQTTVSNLISLVYFMTKSFLPFYLVVFLACYLNYYCLVVFCHHLLLRVRTLLLGRVLVSHVAPGKAQLKIDLNDLDISLCVTAFPQDLFWCLIIPFHNKGICLLSNTQT